ncbi:MAG: NADPH:quinone reductase [Actinomycetales bacterium]|nr:MAG: NADPH:quinone reductase [Actinomycetales bacterium]
MARARALRVPRNGDPDVLRVETVEVPDPGPGQARVRVQASGVNFIDVYQRTGAYPVPTPFTLGLEGAGVVESAGDGVDLTPGARVAWAMKPGSAAELALVPAAALVPVPEAVGTEQAAAALLQGMTAHYLITSTYAVRSGDVVLVHAAAGGVGQWLVQWCAAKGAKVIATAGSAAKLTLARELGAAYTIDYTSIGSGQELASAVRDAAEQVTGEPGVHVAYDGVGRTTFDSSLAALRPRGVLALFGAASGPVPPVDPQRLNVAGSVFLTRPSLAHFIADPDELQQRAAAVLNAVTDGSVRLQIGGRWPLEEAPAAYRALAERRSTGKLMLTT